MGEIYTRLIKTVAGNGSSKLKIVPSPGKRIFSLQLELTYAGGTNTLAALMTALTEIRWKVGTVVRSKTTGTKLRDWLLLHGTTYDFNGLPNTGAQITIPFAPEFLLDNVSDALAWNPNLLGDAISVEIDSTAVLTVNAAYERVDDDMNAPSTGILTFDVLNPVAGGTSFFVSDEIDIRGHLMAISIYPDSTNSNEITPAALLLGAAQVYAHEELTSAQNDEQLERYSLTPAASGRTANIYDIVPVKADMLARAWDLVAWGIAKIRVRAAAAMAGTVDILLVRIEANKLS